MILVRLTALVFALALIQFSLAEEAKKLSGYGYPSSNYGPSNYPTSNYPTSNYPTSNYPTSNYPTSNYPTSNYPTSNYPKSNYPTSNYPTSNYGLSNGYKSPTSYSSTNPYNIGISSLKYWFTVAMKEKRFFPEFKVCFDTSTSNIPSTCFYRVDMMQKKTAVVCPYNTVHKCNQCANNPCQNGATCITTADNQQMCACTFGFTGDRCETYISECKISPCTSTVLKPICFNTGTSVVDKQMCGVFCICSDAVSISNKYEAGKVLQLTLVTKEAWFMESQLPTLGSVKFTNTKICQKALATTSIHTDNAFSSNVLVKNICPASFTYTLTMNRTSAMVTSFQLEAKDQFNFKTHMITSIESSTTNFEAYANALAKPVA